jgi:hypothetical protein
MIELVYLDTARTVALFQQTTEQMRLKSLMVVLFAMPFVASALPQLPVAPRPRSACRGGPPSRHARCTDLPIGPAYDRVHLT